jgi:hypothetical protein
VRAGNSKRLRREQQPGEEEARARTALSGNKSQKTLATAGAVYVGYVTKHYPPDLDGGEMTKELFHVECGDGDEKDMGGREVAAAAALGVQA